MPDGRSNNRRRTPVTPAQVERMRWMRIKEGLTHREIGERLGLNIRTVQGHLANVMPEATALAPSEIPHPLRWGELSDDAKRGVEDKRFFRERYFNRQAPPFQVHAAS